MTLKEKWIAQILETATAHSVSLPPQTRCALEPLPTRSLEFIATLISLASQAGWQDALTSSQISAREQQDAHRPSQTPF